MGLMGRMRLIGPMSLISPIRATPIISDPFDAPGACSAQGFLLLIKTQRDQKVDCVLQALILQLYFGGLAGFLLFISIEFRISAVDQSRFI